MKSFPEIWNESIIRIPGLVIEEEMRLMYDLIRKNIDHIKSAVEIGSLFGLSSSIIATALDSGNLYCVEPFAVQGSDTEPFFKKNTLNWFPNITLLEMTSDKAAVEFHKPFDFIFIDGDHQDDGIQRDVRNWLPKLSLKGFAAFHDYNNEMFPSIRRRVEEVTAFWPMVGQAGSLIIKQKI